MPWDPNRSIQDSPDLSPTTLILNYLKSQGTPITPENIRRAVESNARGDTAGPDPVAGLRSDRPATEAEDQAAMRAGGGGSGSASGGGRTSAKPAPVSAAPVDRHDDGTPAPGATTAAGGGGDMDIGKMIAMGLPPAALATGLATLYGLNRGQPQTSVGAPPAAAPEVAPPPSGMEASMQKAVSDPRVTVENITPGSVPPVPPAPVAPPPAEMPEVPFNSPGPRVPPTEQFVRQGPPGLNLTQPTEPNVPFTARPGGAARVAPTVPLTPNPNPRLTLRPNLGPAAEALARLRGLPR